MHLHELSLIFVFSFQAPLGSRPLLQWSLNAMVQYGGFDSLWVSTDHPAIATCATSLPGVKVFARSPHLARSDTPSVAAVQEFLSRHPEVDVVGLVQCTSPFLRPECKSRIWFQNTVKLGYNKFGYNKQIFQSQMKI